MTPFLRRTLEHHLEGVIHIGNPDFPLMPTLDVHTPGIHALRQTGVVFHKIIETDPGIILLPVALGSGTGKETGQG